MVIVTTPGLASCFVVKVYDQCPVAWLADESAESELCHHTKTADLMAMSRKHVAEVQA